MSKHNDNCVRNLFGPHVIDRRQEFHLIWHPETKLWLRVNSSLFFQFRQELLDDLSMQADGWKCLHCDMDGDVLTWP